MLAVRGEDGAPDTMLLVRVPPCLRKNNLDDAIVMARNYLAARGVPASQLLPQRPPVSVPLGLADAVDFLTRLADGGRITLGAVTPDVKGRIGATFDMPAGQSAACQWLASRADTANLYFVLNEAAPAVEQRWEDGACQLWLACFH
ncbi:hypothetical protein [Methylobacterium brachythecii]|uniref:hypothetical protein n=1 Tax=Methylobacterium brachythecii TaxID=1176177 RepID=UPI0024E0E812|nr:hypothetical protein [Methylobacterium brachythecii]